MFKKTNTEIKKYQEAIVRGKKKRDDSIIKTKKKQKNLKMSSCLVSIGANYGFWLECDSFFQRVMKKIKGVNRSNLINKYLSTSSGSLKKKTKQTWISILCACSSIIRLSSSLIKR